MIELKLESTPRLLEYLFRGQASKIVTTKSKPGKGPDYYVPEELGEQSLKKYTETMDWLFRYQKTFLKNKKAKFVAGDLRPFSELVDLKISIETNKLIDIAEKLAAFDTTYFNNISKSLSKAAGATKPLSIHATIDGLIRQSLPNETELVKVLRSSPLNEQDIASSYAFQFAESSFEKLTTQFDGLSFKKKNDFLALVLDKAKPDSLRIELEVIARPLEVHKLINSGIIYRLQKQPLAPYFGYNIDDSNVDDTTAEMIEKCFDFSYQLFSELQRSKKPQLAQLAVLNGYRQRMLISINLQGLRALRGLKTNDSKFYRRLKEEVAGQFPQITELTS